MMSPKIVSREEWVEARRPLLAKEKELTRQRDRLAAERRALPWVRVEKEYVFDGPQGPVTLADLFDGRSQLFLKHFMMGPGQVTQCVGCSLEVDHLEGILTHLQSHDLSYAVVARAPIEEIEAVRRRMGWRFPWVSSYRSDFNYDFHVSFTPAELAAGRAVYNFGYEHPGVEDRSGDSVFVKNDAGEIFHTYSVYARGGEEFLGIYRYLDATPKGRGEDGPYQTLADWVRPRNRYAEGGMVEGNGRYHQAACACAAHRCETLANQLDAKVEAAVILLRSLGEADWSKVTEAEKWTVAVTAHHYAGALEPVSHLIEALVAGERGTLTSAMLDQMNAQHARDYADCGKEETIELLRKGAGVAGATLRRLRADQLAISGTVLADRPPMTVEQLVHAALLAHLDEHFGSIRRTVGR